MSLLDLVRRRAAELGLHRIGVTTAAPPARAGAYRAWLDAGCHGEMSYMADPDHVRGRTDPSALLPGVRSIVVAALAYPRPADTGGDDDVPRGRIAAYAGGDDYHTVLHDKLLALAADLERAGARTRVCVDTAPVLERELAERAGLGFVGKNTMLIAPGLGSYLVLGEILCDVDLDTTERDDDAAARCGSCRACLDACPTGAFDDAYRLDARRCIAYLTIEQRATIPEALRPAVGAWVFGCDACQTACPYNAAAPDRSAPAPELAVRDADHARPDLIRLLGLGANQRRQFVRGSAMRRVGRAELARNACVALGNLADPRAREALEAAAGDRSPVVADSARWALTRLASRDGERG